MVTDFTRNSDEQITLNSLLTYCLNVISSLMIKFRFYHALFFSMEDARALKTGSSKNISTISDCNSILTPVFKGNLFPSVVKEKI